MRKVAASRELVLAHERAGNLVRSHHLYAAAAEEYQKALHVEGIANSDHLRISESLGYALFLGGDPIAANQWFDTVLASYLANPNTIAQAIHTLRRIAGQLWIEAKTEARLQLDTQALRLATASGDAGLRKRANVLAANTLNLLGRFAEAEKFMLVAKGIDVDDLSANIEYHLHKGYTLAAFGNAQEAYENFDRAIVLTQEDADLARVTAVWESYALWALALGDIERAKTHYERALLVARQNGLAWFIPFLCIDYADLLARMGQERAAYEYLIEAISYEARAPILEMKFAAVGIPLALRMNDLVTLARCSRQETIGLAFQSGQPCRIGPVAAAFARFHMERGQTYEAEALLHRALEHVTYIDESFDLPIEVARYGAIEDIPKARNLLTSRLRLPNAEVARALLSLFEMTVEHRQGRLSQAYVHATAAEQAFVALHWYACAETARSMLPVSGPHPTQYHLPFKPFSDVKLALTKREQEVAELALRRLTNREIGQVLGISEHTIEKHMTSIMERLGIHSRRQLVDVLAEPQDD